MLQSGTHDGRSRTYSKPFQWYLGLTKTFTKECGKKMDFLRHQAMGHCRILDENQPLHQFLGPEYVLSRTMKKKVRQICTAPQINCYRNCHLVSGFWSRITIQARSLKKGYGKRGSKRDWLVTVQLVKGKSKQLFARWSVKRVNTC